MSMPAPKTIVCKDCNRIVTEGYIVEKKLEMVIRNNPRKLHGIERYYIPLGCYCNECYHKQKYKD